MGFSGLHFCVSSFDKVGCLGNGFFAAPHQVSVSEVKVVVEEQFGELLAAMRKAQADVMLFLEEKEQAALSQANGIKTHLEYRSAEMEKSKQELERIAAISNTVLFLEVPEEGGGGEGCVGEFWGWGWGGGGRGVHRTNAREYPLFARPVADVEVFFDKWGA